MNCLEFRQALLTDPSILNQELRHHLHDCPSCAQFAANTSDFESQLASAVDVDIPDGLSSRILLRQRLASQQQHNRRRNSWLAFAASLILGVVVLMGVEHQITEPSLEQVVLRHVNDELHHLKDNYDLDLAKLNRVLGDYGSKIESLSNRRINYAGACQMRRQRGAHLVIDSEQGPITVLLMPGEFVDARKLIKDKRFQGVIIPVENGSLAILGEDPKEVERLERDFVSQLRLIS